MKKILSRFAVILLIFSMISSVNVEAVIDTNTLNSSISTTVNEILSRKSEPVYGDEWSIIALSRSGQKIPQSYYDTYYKSVEEKVVEESKKAVPFTSDPDKDDWTSVNDLERVIIALNAIGKNPENVNGLNLVNLIFNRENLAEENGVSGLAYALIAIDTKNYAEIPGVLNTRDKIIKDMLALRTKDGGFSWDSSAENADLDTTAIALQALYKYSDRSDVKEAINASIDILKKNQTENGDYVGSYMGNTYESPCTAAQVVVALDNLNINPTVSSNGFIKNKDLIEVMQSYYVSGGGFKNSSDESEVNDMTTDQILYALDSYKRLLEGKNTLYDMNDNAVIDEIIKEEHYENTEVKLSSGNEKIDVVEVPVEEISHDEANVEESVAKTGDSISGSITLAMAICGIIMIKSKRVKKVM